MFELLMAVFITAITLVAIVNLVSNSVSNSTFSRDRSEAVRYTNEIAEWLRSERDEDWIAFTARGAVGAGRIYCLTSSTWPTSSGACNSTSVIPNTKFTRQATLIYDASSDPNTVEAQIVTTWSDSGGTHESRTSIILTNWRTS